MRATQTTLAKRLKCSRQAISKHLQNADAPAPDRSGRYDAATVADYVKTRRAMDNDGASSKALLAAKINKLRLECDELRRKLKTDVASVPVDDISALLWRAVNEQHRCLIAALNGTTERLASETRTHEILRTLHKALAAAESGFCSWMQENGLAAGGVKIEWPLPHPSLMCRMPEVDNSGHI